MKVPFTLGVVGHFGLAVRSPRRSAKWWERALGLKKQFEFEGGIAVGNANVTIALHKGRPSPETLDHLSFHLPSMAVLRKALAHLRRQEVDLELTAEPSIGEKYHVREGRTQIKKKAKAVDRKMGTTGRNLALLKKKS